MDQNGFGGVRDMTDDEVICFFGVLLLCGYSPHPRMSVYWENCRDTNNVLVSEAISRNRFNFIMLNIHCCNNAELQANDKFAKLRPLGIDESMVPYFGHHGYKLWVGSTVPGYIECFEPYQGSTTVLSDKYEELGLGATVVLEFAEVLQKGTGTIRQHRVGKECSLSRSTEMKKKREVQ
nr:unnamed protein product [Callosobruchus chinensis]